MSGMNSGLNPASPILVSAFRTALLQQWLIVAVIFALLLIAWGASRTAIFGTRPGAAPSAAGRPWREPRAHAVLRIGFGAIWLFDGLLQAQPQMAGGLADQVIKPTAATSPGWVQHLVNFGVTAWDYHPVQAATATVWIQVGIGLWLIFAVRGWSGRLAGLAGLGWGLIVWAFGESFGGIFAPGLTVLFGAPGAALLYAVAGALLALPERTWDTPRPGRLLLGGTGAFLLCMALLQAWPGRGFWQGTVDGNPGSLAGMIQSMAGTSQPHAIESLVSGFGNFTQAHGFAVNLVAVIALASVGAGSVVAAARTDLRLARIAVVVGIVFCLADWLLVEDLGFFGGLGTDPNSMIPLALLLSAGYVGLAPAPRPHLPQPALATQAPDIESVALVPALEGASHGGTDVSAPAVATELTRDVAVAADVAQASGDAAGTAGATEVARGAAKPADASEPSVSTELVDTPIADAGRQAGPANAGATARFGGPGGGGAAKGGVAQASAAGGGDSAPRERGSAAREGGSAHGGGGSATREGGSAAGGGGGAPGLSSDGGGSATGQPGWFARLLRGFAVTPVRVVCAAGALSVILVGAAPMAFASVNRTADPIIAQAIAGTTGQLDTPAPGFTLTSQDGRPVSLASLRGKVVLLAFLDPVCTTDCPLIAQEMRSADAMLGAKAANTELVAVVANPTYTSVAYTRAFTSQENLSQVRNWLYLTGSLSQLTSVWHHYGIEVENLPAGAMSAHNDVAFVIDADGTMQQELSDDPGPGTPASTSSFAVLMANSVRQAMGNS